MSTQKAAAVSVPEAKSLFNDLKDVPALVLAVSGGPDSTALMVLAAHWAKALKKSPKLIAVTVDHGLRAESAREAAAVKRLARTLGIEHRTLRWTGKKPATGLQEAARAARYGLLAEVARKAGAHHIVTAHTLDDQAETVLIRLTRGSGLTGLAAMKRRTPLPTAQRPPLEGEGWGGGSSVGSRKTVPARRASRVDLSRKGGGDMARPSRTELLLVRPLLDIPKVRLIATLQQAKIRFAEDPSNRDPRFTRARLRGLMPVLAREGLDAGRLALLSRRLARADAAIEAAVDAAYAVLSRPAAAARSRELDAMDYSALPAEISLRLLGRALAVAADGPVALAKLEVLKEALDAAVEAGNARFRRSLAGAMVTLAKGRIVVETAPSRRGKALTTGRRGRARVAKTR